MHSHELEVDHQGERWIEFSGGLFSREHNMRVVLQGHDHNIPSISFRNPEDTDEDGVEILVSTDIGGAMIEWNVREKRATSMFQLHDAVKGVRATDGHFQK